MKSMEGTYQRLSSGLRINSAKDDAAGMAISTRMTSQIRGLSQAIKNTNDGISLAQTVEGALHETTNLLQRMRELAVQSANDSNTATDRESIDAEIQQLLAEIDSIGSTTTFNNQRVLDGSFVESYVQVGFNARETVRLSIADARAGALGRAAVSTGAAATTDALAAGDLVLNGVNVRATLSDGVSTANADGSAIAKAAAVNAATEFHGVTARALTTVLSAAGAIAGGVLDGANYFTVNGVDFSGFTAIASDGDGELVNQINARYKDTGVIASLDATGQLELQASDGRNIEVAVVGTAGVTTGLAAGVTSAAIEITSDDQIALTGANTAFAGWAVNQIVGLSQQSSLTSIDVLSRENANRTIEVIDRALQDVSGERADLGAVQNRFASTISTLANTVENVSAARGRIQDADFAAETASLSRLQILQQAGTAMLAQANQQPSIALSLLG